ASGEIKDRELLVEAALQASVAGTKAEAELRATNEESLGKFQVDRIGVDLIIEVLGSHDIRAIRGALLALVGIVIPIASAQAPASHGDVLGPHTRRGFVLKVVLRIKARVAILDARFEVRGFNSHAPAVRPAAHAA